MAPCPHLHAGNILGGDGVLLAPVRAPGVGAELQQHPAPVRNPGVLQNKRGGDSWGLVSPPQYGGCLPPAALTLGVLGVLAGSNRGP